MHDQIRVKREQADSRKRIARLREMNAEKVKKFKKVRAYNKSYYNKHKVEFKQKSRMDRIKKKYNLTEEEFNAKLESQFHCCAICMHNDHRSSNWHVDHSHRTNLVRGILCGHCNAMLGYARENLVTLYRAMDYLKDWNAKEG